MTVLFDRTAPLFFVLPDPVEGNYDGIGVDVPQSIGDFLSGLNDLVVQTQLSFLEVGAPEDSNQQLAEVFVDAFAVLMEEYNG